MKKGDVLKIQCYKHDGCVHKVWNEAVILDETKDYIVCANNKTEVLKVDGSVWKTKEPSISFFYKDNWFNVIGQIKRNGIYYYCNIASPYVISENVIKYIDYDLDLRVFPDGGFKILDRNEYNLHKRIMNYSKDIDFVVNTELQTLIQIVKNKQLPFKEEIIMKYFDQYKKIMEKKEKENT
ncbi:MAG: DUF402 domain-containing protein [Bacilli bacterium]